MNELLVRENGRVLEVILNRPQKYNALTLEMLDGLVDATQRLAAHDHLQVLVVRAMGKYFSAGIDLSGDLAPDLGITSPTAFRRWYRDGRGCIHPLGDLWEAVEKPVVVAHQGPCLGGALELSLCADFRIASEAASYGLPEIAMGALPGSGGTSRLARLTGVHWTRWLVLANQRVDAARALAIGLVHDVHPADSFDASVDVFCATLAGLPREAFAAGKIAIELAVDLGRAEARNVERLAVSGIAMGSEYRETAARYMARFSATG